MHYTTASLHNVFLSGIRSPRYVGLYRSPFKLTLVQKNITLIKIWYWPSILNDVAGCKLILQYLLSSYICIIYAVLKVKRTWVSSDGLSCNIHAQFIVSMYLVSSQAVILGQCCTEMAKNPQNERKNECSVCGIYIYIYTVDCEQNGDMSKHWIFSFSCLAYSQSVDMPRQ